MSPKRILKFEHVMCLPIALCVLPQSRTLCQRLKRHYQYALNSVGWRRRMRYYYYCTVL